MLAASGLGERGVHWEAQAQKALAMAGHLSGARALDLDLSGCLFFPPLGLGGAGLGRRDPK